jgi:hypothetical protein
MRFSLCVLSRDDCYSNVIAEKRRAWDCLALFGQAMTLAGTVGR